MKSALLHILLGIGSALLVIGVFGNIFWPKIYQSIVNSQMILSPTSEAYSTWQDPPFPIFLRVYLFNCTNSEELIAKKFSVKPKMVEMGPYTFREKRVKENITWNSNGTVSYVVTRYWHHLPEETNGSLDDVVTNLNVPVVTAAFVSRFSDDFIRVAVDEIIGFVNETLFMSGTVRELLFDGYNSSFLNAAEMSPYAVNIPFDKFGWFYEKNNSVDGVYTVFTGETNTDHIALIDKWNGSSYLPYWTDDCNVIKGTVGEIWPPGKKANEPLTFFVSDVCRTLSLDYDGKTSYEDIGVYKYTPSDKLFANSSVNPDNACYNNGNDSLPNGLVNETACKFGAPAFLSFPHFYMADPMLAERVEGLHQDWTNHTTTILLEPITGAPVSVSAKFQVNLFIEEYDRMAHFAGIPPTYFPMLWFSESVELGDTNMMSMLKMVAVILPIVFFVLFIVALVAGLGLMLPALTHYGRRVCFKLRKDGTADETRAALLSSGSPSNTQYVQ